MGTISVTLPSDGQTADAADYNVPINTIVALLNGGIDSDNIEAGGVVPNSLVSGTGTSWAWQSWTPTLTNMTLGNGTVVAKYIQIGKTIFFKFKFVLGSTSAMATSPSFSSPVTLVSPDPANTYIGTARLQGTDTCPGGTLHNSTTAIALIAYDANATYPRETAITSTVPFTWTTNHVLMCWGIVEAA